MRMRPRRARTGFTLLEVLLASLIAILLMAALYFAMDVTLRQTQESRDAVDVDNLSRGVYTRMSLDLSSSLGPLPPKSGGNSASSSSSAPSSGSTPADPTMMTTPSSSTPSSPPTTPSATTSATPPTAAATDPAAAATPAVDPTTGEAVSVPQAADVGFQAGIVGTDKQLTVFASRLPAAFTHGRGLGGSSGPGDLVRITYWISQNGGLCRQERPWVTADGVRNSTDPDLNDEAGDTLVQEVSDVTFEYFDGSSWLPSWDGSQPSPDGVTPTGPPRAVKVTLTYSIPAARKGDPPYEHSVVQVIPVRAAPGSYTPEMITPSTDMGTTSTDPASGGSSANMNTTGSAATPNQNSGGTTPMSGGTIPTGGAGTKTGGSAPTGGAGTKMGGSAPTGGTKTGGGAPTGGGAKGGGGGR